MTSRKLYLFEWIGCVAWALFWGALAYVALTERSITLGSGKYSLVGVTHHEGAGAVAVGFVMLALAAAGIGWLFRLNAYRRLLRFGLFVLWLGFVVAYFWF